MKKLLLPLIAAVLPSIPCLAEFVMSQEAVRDRIRGAWAGQIIGCTYGGPTEFRFGSMINKEIEIPWDSHRIKYYYDNFPGLYDDVYMDLTFVDVFSREGLDAPVGSFAKAFAEAEYPLWHANRAARYNILHGIDPPGSGYWENNPHADDIDFQIEADYAGIMSPGMPRAASGFTDGIGHIMNYGDGWYGGVYVANMYSLAFVSTSMEFVVEEALKAVPERSRFHRCISDVIGWHRQYPEDWEIAWALVNRDYGFDTGCPDGVLEEFDIDAVLNGAYIVIGLLYGEKDFFRTMDIATRCGADSDCNPASAAGILGAMIGYSRIPEKWKEPLYEVADRPFKYTDISFEKACELSYAQAVEVIERNGGTSYEGKVSIQVQSPEPVRFEESFPGLKPVLKERMNVKLSDDAVIGFDGAGVVLNYHFSEGTGYVPGQGYEARVEVFLDGEPAGEVLLPHGGNCLRDELFFRYDLQQGPHKLAFRWKNKPEGLDIVVNRLIVYLKH
ncbi:MAG: ADP-ribosylglycohydrolase family protein [Bacteroidales bacterium]|nr:ADP-ribosylglycohydrolase family protein [Bacteroidales bacterium]